MIGDKQIYLGDGVYVTNDGFQFWLRTLRENGWHEIALDGSMIENLLDYARSIQNRE